MLDPLATFDWSRLYERYDARCSKGGAFQPGATYLDSFRPSPDSDRTLYYALIERFAQRAGPTPISLNTYEGMLYWKLYSQRGAVRKHCDRLALDATLRGITGVELIRIVRALPLTMPRDVEQIVRTLTGLTKTLYGMAGTCAIPVRTTFLHFIYPDVIPIFDKQVLLAVGISEKDANHSYEFLRDYIPHAWSLAEKYRQQLTIFQKETPVRIVDMALWVCRGG